MREAVGTLREWEKVFTLAAIWAIGMPFFFYVYSFLPDHLFRAARRQIVLVRIHPWAFVCWGLAGLVFGLWVVFGSRVLRGGMLVILVMAIAGVLATIVLSNRFARPKLN
jgi:hypothetical protein